MLLFALFLALTPASAYRWSMMKVGNGGCSCRNGAQTEDFCRTGSEQWKLKSKDECAKKAYAIGAAGFEWGAPDNCMTQSAYPIKGNNYPGVTCYKLVTPGSLKLRGFGGCSCGSETFCRTRSESWKLPLGACKAKAVEVGAKAIEFGGKDNCITHKMRATGSNGYPGVLCYDVKIGRFYDTTADRNFMVSQATQTSTVVRALALVGFVAVVYGAVRHYVK